MVVENLPKFWPILFPINTPGYNLAKILIPILEPLVHNEFTIKDSFSFAKDIATYDSSLYMASLDNESLFTNIPLNETIERDLFKLLETATSETSFIFDYYFIKKFAEWQWVGSHPCKCIFMPLWKRMVG